RQPTVMTELMEWMATDPGCLTWRPSLTRLLGRWTDLLRNVAPATPHPPLDPKVLIAVRRLQASFRDPELNLSSVAEEAGLSVSHLGRMLKRHTGLGFNASVQQLRVEEGRRLLADGRLTIKEVAVAVGCGDATQFGRYFKRTYGITPRAFR